MSEPLKPCPFCGDAPKNYGGDQWYCDNQECPESGAFPLALWNRRAPDPLLGLLREARDALQEMVEGCDSEFGRRATDVNFSLARVILSRLDAALSETPKAGDRYREVRAAFVAGSAWGFGRDSYLESECEAEALRRWPAAALPPGESAGEKEEAK